MKSAVVRIPIEDVREIAKIQTKYGINFNAAYKIWKKNNLGIKKWQDF